MDRNQCEVCVLFCNMLYQLIIIFLFICHFSPSSRRTCPDWVNPAQYGLVMITTSDGRNLPYGRLEDILSRDTAALNCHTNDDKNAWFAIDLGLYVIPTCYTLRHARGYGRSALRNWNFQVSYWM